MSKHSGKQSVCSVPTASTPHAELQRHIAALKLPGIAAYQAWCREHGFGPALHKNGRQRQQELLCAQRLEAYANACAVRNRHIRSLGLESVEDYEAWCRRHGFSCALHKSTQQRAQEERVADRERAAQALIASRRLHHRPEGLICAIYEKRVAWTALSTAYEGKIHTLFACPKSKPRASEALLRLLLHLSNGTSLLTVEPAIPVLGLQPGNTFPDALRLLAERHREWICPLEDWKPKTHNPRRQFSALVRHLLAHYAVPEFMDAAWFEGEDAVAQRHQEWFLHIANGCNIRTANLPVTLTKMAAHYCLQAPRDFSIITALRWGQALGMGGSEYLARALVGSRLMDILPDEPFWATVIQFFVNSPMLDAAQVGPLVDYLYHQKFVPQEVCDAAGRIVRVGPPEPDLVMKGRTATALLRRMETWHRHLAQEHKRPPLEWARSGIGEFRLVQREELTEEVTCWTIQEILSSKELQVEGRAMHNCVATYAASCQQGRCSIWSLRVVTSRNPSPRSTMTIEVDTSKRAIVQARGRCNVLPRQSPGNARLQSASQILRRWAEEEQLAITRYACG